MIRELQGGQLGLKTPRCVCLKGLMNIMLFDTPLRDTVVNRDLERYSINRSTQPLRSILKYGHLM